MKAVPRSVGSVISESFSTPMTSTCRALPARTMSEASAMPWQKPAHAAETSYAAACSVPSSCATAVASAGVCRKWLTVATTTQSTWRGSIPDRSRACRAAPTAITWTVSSGVAQRRLSMPERCRIHSSDVSTISDNSALVRMRSGR